MPLGFLGLLFFAIELAALLQIGEAIGVLATLLWIIASAVLGVQLMRRLGAQALDNVRIAAAEGRSPAKELKETLLVMLAGLLLFIPGFVSDALGLLLLTPLRGLIAATALGGWVARHAPTSDRWTAWNGKAPGSAGHRSKDIIEGEYTSLDDEK